MRGMSFDRVVYSTIHAYSTNHTNEVNMNPELKEQWESIKELSKLHKELKKKLKTVKFNNESAKQLIKIYGDVIKSVEKLL